MKMNIHDNGLGIGCQHCKYLGFATPKKIGQFEVESTKLNLSRVATFIQRFLINLISKERGPVADCS